MARDKSKTPDKVTGKNVSKKQDDLTAHALPKDLIADEGLLNVVPQNGEMEWLDLDSAAVIPWEFIAEDSDQGSTEPGFIITRRDGTVEKHPLDSENLNIEHGDKIEIVGEGIEVTGGRRVDDHLELFINGETTRINSFYTEGTGEYHVPQLTLPNGFHILPVDEQRLTNKPLLQDDAGGLNIRDGIGVNLATFTSEGRFVKIDMPGFEIQSERPLIGNQRGAEESGAAPTSDAPVINLLFANVLFNENIVNASAQIVDSTLTVTDTDSADFAGGNLITSWTVGSSSSDQFSILDGGNITVVGSSVRFSGLEIGTIDSTNNGVNGNALQVNFNSDATVGRVQELVRQLGYQNTSDSPIFNKTFNYQISDGDGGVSVARSKDILVFSQNDAPLLSNLVASNTFGENIVNVSAQVVDSDVNVIDADSSNFNNGNITVTYSSGGGAEDQLSITDGGNITVSGTAVSHSGTQIGTITTDGANGTSLVISLNTNATASNVEELLERLSYQNTSNTPTAARTLSITINDGDGGTSSAQTSVINVTAENDAPVFSDLVTTRSFLENTLNSSAQIIDNNVTLGDVDSSNLDGGTVTVNYSSGGGSADQLSFLNGGNISISGTTVSHSGTQIGTITSDGVNGSNLVVSLNANAIPSNVEELVERLFYQNNSDTPAASRTISITVNDGDGGTSAAQTTVINITAENDVPVLSGLVASNTFGENTVNATAQQIDSDVTLSDADLTDFNGGNVTVTYSSGGGTEDQLSITDGGNITVSGMVVSHSGTQIGTITTDGANGANLVISLNVNATASNVEDLLERLSYQNTSDTPTSDRTISITVNDGDGGTSSSQTSVINVTAENDAPVISNLLTAITFNENDVNDTSGEYIDQDVLVTDPDSANFDGGVLTFSYSSGGSAEDQISLNEVGDVGLSDTIVGADVTHNFVTVGTISADGANGTTFSITFNNVSTAAIIDEIIEAIIYRNTSDDPTASRTISVTLTDGDGGTSSAINIVVNVTAQPEALFDNGDNTVNFDTITTADYQAGTQYDALSGNDNVTLPSDSTEASDAGFVVGTTFEGSFGDDTITGGSLNDVIDGGFGSDSILGGAGDDSINASFNNDFVDAGSGNDTVEGGTGADTLDGGADTDLITYINSTTTGVNVNLETGLVSNDGTGAGGLDTLSNFENLLGSNNADTIVGSNSVNNLLRGADGADSITAGTNAIDTLEGGAGNDTLTGSGNDFLSYANDSAGVNINLTQSSGTDGSGATDSYTGVVNVIGSAFNDTLAGGLGTNTINAGDGNDIITDLSSGGVDVFNGGEGNDTFVGVIGANTLDGGNGIDVLDLSSEAIASSVDFNTNSKTGGSGNSTIQGFESVLFGSGNDTFLGSTGDDSVSGGLGADILIGGNGNDTLDGGSQADSLNGGSGNDSLVSDGGMATLVGSQGNDTLHAEGGIPAIMQGGSGDDLLIFENNPLASIASTSVSGGLDVDTLQFGSTVLGETLNLTAIGDSVITGIDIIDIDGGANNTLILNATDVAAIGDAAGVTIDSNLYTDSVFVNGSAGDTVQSADSGWTNNGTVFVNSISYTHYSNGSSNLYIDNDVTQTISS